MHRQRVDNREEPVYVNVESRTKKYSCSLPGRDGYNFCEYKVAGKYHIVGLVGNPYGDSYDEIVDASIMREGVIKFPNGAMMKGEFRPPFTYSSHLIGEGGLDRDRPKFNSRKLHGGSAGSSSTDNNPILKNTSGQIRVCEDDLEARCYFRDGSRVKVEEYNDFAEATSKAEKTKRKHIVSDPYQSSDEILRVLRDNAPELIF